MAEGSGEQIFVSTLLPRSLSRKNLLRANGQSRKGLLGGGAVTAPSLGTRV